MRVSKLIGIIVAAAALCLVPTSLVGQETARAVRTTNSAPKPTGATPRTADGHPNLTGVWNGLGENLNGVPNQMANNGVVIESDTTARDLHSGQIIAVFPRNMTRPQNNEEAERAAALVRRIGANRPIYKPEYWQMVRDLDHNSNEEDPSNRCMPAGIPRAGIPGYIGQLANHVIFVYPGQGGLIATTPMYRMIPTDGRTHTPLRDLDGTYTGESIGHWEGDTLVVDSWGFTPNTWFDQIGGYTHGENMHVIERFRREGNTLTWTTTVTDPDFLLEPWTSTPRVALLNPRANAVFPESQPCSERDLDHLVTKEHH
jgi:hypothetical protein